ncbi:hypothetical protein CRG98_040348 [Punica granatum]|uniref:TIR domain-containing protein n=1 Tax=Punica granatum TaxID=22663 RepID=A0A2I0I5N7_PUNGR|nr:hypothetical protein CRG98_040348 [Punica granatum]
MASPDAGGRGGKLELVASIALVIVLLKFFLAGWLVCLLLSVIEFFEERRAPDLPGDRKPNPGHGPAEAMSESDRVSLPPGCEYEVFLSFRGPDTRESFTDCLYNSLSKISIPIFSKRYASSKWCLRELSLIAERYRENKQIVMPIFFDVRPDQVKNQTGNYDAALRQHAGKYPQDVGEWRSALSELGQLKGWPLEDTANGYWGQFIKLVVTSVLSKLKKAHLPRNKTFVGIERHADAVMSLLDVGIRDVRIVGIYGIRGIGKTTLAKDIYNKLLDGSEFEGCSSLDNIREKSLPPNGLEWLQSKLVADITRRKGDEFGSVDDGTKVLMDRFRGKKVLILLDDVDNIKQLNVLVAEREWFGIGSRIIITTTDGGILREAPQVDSSYEMGGMEQDEALELFNKHAFRTTDPSTAKLNHLAKKIVKATGGLPLALEIMGSSLYGKNKDIWKETLQKLKERPDKKVIDQLRGTERIKAISLQCELGESFCFDGEQFKNMSNLRFLRLVYAELSGHIRSLSELRWLSWQKSSMKFMPKSLPLAKLKVLDMSGSEVKEDWSAWSSTKKPVKLKVLDLSGCHKLTTTPDLSMFKNLERLILEDCQRLSAFHPTMVGLQCLSSLNLKGCWLSLSHTGVATLPNSVGNLSNMEVLNINANNISHFPSSLGKLGKLKEINASKCKNLKGIPETIRGLSHLQTLHLTGCPKLQSLPELPVSLVSVRVTSQSAGAIPNLPDLINLEELVLSINTLGCEVRSLPRLKVLSFPSCTNLQSLPKLPESLHKLNVSNGSLEILPKLSNLQNLSELSLENCNKLTDIPGLRDLVVLKSLKVDSCLQITSLGGLEQLKSLRVLQVSSCEKLKTLPNLSMLKKLSVMNARGCESLIEIEGLDSLYALTDLDIGNCKSIERLPDLSELTMLRSLSADGCKELQGLKGLGELEKLLSLRISGCRKIKHLPDLSKLKKLKNLNIAGCENISEVLGLWELKSLKCLVISRRISLAKLPDILKEGDVKSPSWDDSSVVSRIITECHNRLRDPRGCLSEAVSSESINGLAVSISEGRVVALYPYDNHRDIRSAP